MSDKYYTFCISIIKSPKHLQQSNLIIIIMGVHIEDNKLLVTTEPYLSWAYNKNEIRQLLSKHKHGNNIHEHEKQ